MKNKSPLNCKYFDVTCSCGTHVSALAGVVVVAQQALAGAGQLQLRGGPALQVPRSQEDGGRRLFALVGRGQPGPEVSDGEAPLLLVPGVGILDGGQLFVLILGLQPPQLPLAKGAEDAADPVLEWRGEVGLGLTRVLEGGAASVAPVLGGLRVTIVEVEGVSLVSAGHQSLLLGADVFE